MLLALHDADADHACPPSLRMLYRYWLGKRRGQALPGRADIDPVELRAYLGRVVIAEVRDGELFYRLVGSDLVEEWGFEATGRRIPDTLPEDLKETVLSPYQAVVDQACPMLAKLPMRNRPWSGLVVDALFLPLARDGRTVDMVLAYDTRPPNTARARVQSIR